MYHHSHYRGNPSNLLPYRCLHVAFETLLALNISGRKNGEKSFFFLMRYSDRGKRNGSVAWCRLCDEHAGRVIQPSAGVLAVAKDGF